MPTEPPPSLLRIGERVAARIDEMLEAEQARWSAIDADLGEPFDALRAFIRGGKRLRPAFCHWGWVGAGGRTGDDEDAGTIGTSQAVLDAGAALELLHTFALVHDDIMDDSVRRHGIECLHVDFAGRHRSRSWHGEDRRFGDGAAILIGDLAFVYADALLLGAPRAALDIFLELRLEVNVGQYLDLLGTASREASAAQARRICVYKSGKYTIERPLHLGAALAGRLDELAPHYTAYGIPLGEAFQLRDDLLGAFGDGARLGKEVAEDLREGKPTALYALARAAARGEDAELLDRRFGHHDIDDDEVAAIQQIMENTGARATVEASVTQLTDEALAAIHTAPIPDRARDELVQLAHFVAGRDF
ncbi:MAG: polyprenyl synthetase family protein [Acidimicrobiales bacterium]